MRPLILFVAVALTWCSAAARSMLAKFVSDDGALSLFLDESGQEAHLMIDGILVALEEVTVADTILATLGADVAITGRFDGDRLHLTLGQGDAEQSWTLVRRSGRGAPQGDEPLVTLLSFVPDTPGARLGGYPGVGFVDLGAAQDLAASRPSSTEDLQAMSDDERARWTTALRRLHTGPVELRTSARPMIGSLDGLLGFGWSQIERALGYGLPPTIGLVIAADIDAERLGERVSRRGFAATEADGVTVWHRGEDGRVNISDREPSDPFVGPLGLAARIALLPGHLVGSRSWSMIHDVIDTARGRYPSLADAPDYRTLARAAVSGEGVLIQAQFLGPLDVGYLASDPLAVLDDAFAAPEGEASGLGPYRLAVLADLQDGPDQVTLVALLYGDADAAAAAMDVLAERLATWVDTTIPTWGVRTDATRLEAGDDGLVAVVASIRHGLEDAAGAGAPPGGALAMWLQALARREFTLLRIGV